MLKKIMLLFICFPVQYSLGAANKVSQEMVKQGAGPSNVKDTLKTVVKCENVQDCLNYAHENGLKHKNAKYNNPTVKCAAQEIDGRTVNYCEFEYLDASKRVIEPMYARLNCARDMSCAEQASCLSGAIPQCDLELGNCYCP